MKNIYVVSNRNNGIDFNYTNKKDAISFAKRLHQIGCTVWVSKVDAKSHKSEMVTVFE